MPFLWATDPHPILTLIRNLHKSQRPWQVKCNTFLSNLRLKILQCLWFQGPQLLNHPQMRFLPKVVKSVISGGFKEDAKVL